MRRKPRPIHDSVREALALPKVSLKPKRRQARFASVAAIVGDTFLAYFGPMIHAHKDKDLPPGAKLSLRRSALLIGDDGPWALWFPFGEGAPGIRVRTGDPNKTAKAIDTLFPDKAMGRDLLRFIRASKRADGERERKLLSSAEMFGGWFRALLSEATLDDLASIIGPGRRLTDQEIAGLTAYLFRKAGVEILEESIRGAFTRWKKSVT